MSIQSQITRISTDRDTIRTKLSSMGLATATDNLDDLASKIENIADKGTPDAEVKEGETYTIAAGYYHGGTVKGVAGGGHYELQAKSNIVPTKSQQTITADEGYYGLSSVQIDAIPDAYQDITRTTATQPDVLSGKLFVDKDGSLVAGTMENNGAVEEKLDIANPSYTVPAGYHNGEGTVAIDVESKSATPTKSQQDIIATTGKVLEKVVVNPIPDKYQDVSEVDAAAEEVIAGKKFVDSDGNVVEGTMANNGAISKTIDGLTSMSATIPAGYTSGGTVSLTNDIENALSAI